ncbi:MAG TPA: UbiA-like polyprenyltransferase [Candidatus Krumholzibacteria bacterium]|nr:UbiA-like polyprenyltransferase [Candidatus Krumholzibacteria bacterium]
MRSLREFLDTIRVEHTIFALPFAYATLFLTSDGWPTASNAIWITVAMVAARTVGMAVNRIIDAEVDARNPRTASRAIPAGRLHSSRALAFTAVALAFFIVAVWQLHPICRMLWPIVVAVMVAYPYAKRVTPLAHLVLGLVYFMVPTSVWLAVTGELSSASLFLGVGAGAWVAGFDIIYACQDVEVDRREKLHSIPADFGVARGLAVAFGLHAAFVVCLVAAGSILSAGRPYYIGVTLTTVLLLYEHRLVKPHDLSKVNAAFFTTNGVVSIALFALIALDTVI